VDWTKFAYVQYVTNEAYLCNSVMIFESLHRLKSKPNRLMMHPDSWKLDDPGLNSETKMLLEKARDEYGVELNPIQVQNGGGEPTWAESFTKLLLFNQTQFDRVLLLDSDGSILNPPDELFLLPSAPVAMPRAYWLDNFLSSQVIVAEPSKFEWQRIEEGIKKHQSTEFDMEIVNQLYGQSCIVIPHRKYDILTGEFRNKEDDHWHYLGSKEEKWDPDQIIKETKFVHFSDWPFPKPWIDGGDGARQQRMPECHQRENGKEDCRDQKYWLWFYSDFSERRQ
ncbi:alphaN-acetylglucosamine transferase, partial [Rhizodiscina lignyota]